MLKLSNIWEKLDETISYMVEPKLKAKYALAYDKKSGRLKIGEIDFLKMVCADFINVTTFRFLFDYDPSTERGIAALIREDPDRVVNKLMVDLNGQLNEHDVPFQGADEVEDVERYRELDERAEFFRNGSEASEDIQWLRDWQAAYDDESDEPDVRALEQIYRKFLRVTGYNMDYDMLAPADLLRELLDANAGEYEPSIQEVVVSAVDRKRYWDLEKELAPLGDQADSHLLHWLMEFAAEWKTAKDKKLRANLMELDRLYTLYLIEMDMVDTELDPIELLKHLENKGT